MGVARGTLITQQTEAGVRAGVYLGEDPDGTGLWAPFPTVEKIEPGDFESHPESFALAVNAGVTPSAVIGGTDSAAPQGTAVQ